MYGTIITERSVYMLKSNQWCAVNWHHTNKKRLESFGYKFTGYKTKVQVRAKHLTPMSHAPVVVICDYCGKEIIKGNHTYQRQHDEEFGDACNDCKTKKERLIFMRNFGVHNPSLLPQVQKKRFDTIKERYGCENPSQIDGVQEKKEQTCMRNYGVRIPLQSKAIRERVARTTLEHDNCPTSKQQYAVYEMLKERYGSCELNKQCSKNILDCALTIDTHKIDVEYDGSYWHQDPQKDRRRDEVVKSYGYKILRIKGGHKVPTIEQLDEAIDYLVKGNHTFATIILDE